MGVSSKLFRVVESLYDLASLRVKCKNGHSKKIDITEGVFQSEILSTLLFILFITDIEQIFRDEGLRSIDINGIIDPLFLLYTNDLIIFSN